MSYSDGLTLYVDGGCSGNGQRSPTKRRMVSVVTDETGVVLTERFADGGSSNIAELSAVRDAVSWCGMMGIVQATIMTDSKNNLAWTFGRRVGKAINDRETVLAIKTEITAAFIAGFDLTMKWIPRDENLAGHYIERVHTL